VGREQHGITKRAIYDRIQAVRKDYSNTISPRMATFILASRMGIDVYKNIKNPDELRELRDIISPAPLGEILKKFPQVVTRKRKIPRKKNNRVFIVHGRDAKPVNELKTMLLSLGLKPVVLHEQPSGSRTVIEKLEKYSNVSYAFVILTPDDVGYLQGDVEHLFFSQEKKHPVLSDIRPLIREKFFGAVLDSYEEFLSFLKERARQNVILELGYFMASLGRSRVCCLYKGDIDYPSDIRGIVTIPFNKSIKEVKKKIITELRGAKFDLTDKEFRIKK
jgi:predicted nucleotide-binding protein